MSEIERTGDWRADAQAHVRAIEEIAGEEQAIDASYGGLVDLDVSFDLIERRLRLAVLLVRHPDLRDEREKRMLARRSAVDAVLLLERLTSANVSLDQAGVIAEDPRMEPIHDLLSELIFFGGASLFESYPDARASRRLVRIVTAALLKQSPREAAAAGAAGAGGEGDPGALEIEPGEEGLIFSDYMMLPISQAALMIRDEVIPELKRRLEADPGNPELQEHLRRLEQQAGILEQTRFFPRARPIELEPGLLTASIIGYTPGGEAIVRMRVPVISSTGNRLDRIRESIQSEILRDVAGSGISPEIDREFRLAMSPESGLRGGSSDPLGTSLRIDELFRMLSTQYPFLKRLYDREEMAKLVDLAEKGEAREVRAYLRSAARSDRSFLADTPHSTIDAPEG
jgi:hypothetical protein